MRKIHPINTTDIEKSVMSKVTENQIIMKPRWYFVLGSTVMIGGLVGLGILATYLTNLTLFLLKKHGPNGQWRLLQLLESFPLWVPVLAIGGIALGILLLRKYDFSYQKNFLLIIIGLITSIILAAFLMDYLGLNETLYKQEPMMRFYQQIEGQKPTPSRVPAQRHNGGGNRFLLR